MTARPGAPGGREFFIGWQPAPAAGPVRFVRRRALPVTLALIALAVLLARLQGTIGPASASGPRQLRGVLLREPIPILIADDPTAARGKRLYYLANELELGNELAATHHLEEVELEGLVFERAGSLTMLQVDPASVRVVGEAAEPSLGEPRSLGSMTLRGEIVDSKCFMGAMNPGVWKPHRACAMLCIQSGIPPMLVVRSQGQETNCFLLFDERGDPVNERVLDHVALPVEITGEVERIGTTLVLKAPLASYRILEP